MWGFLPLPAGIGWIVIIIIILAFPQVGIGLLLAGFGILLINAGFGFVSSMLITILAFIVMVSVFCINEQNKELERENKIREKLHILDKEFSDIKGFDPLAELEEACENHTIENKTLEEIEEIDRKAGRWAEWKKRRDEILQDYNN